MDARVGGDGCVDLLDVLGGERLRCRDRKDAWDGAEVEGEESVKDETEYPECRHGDDNFADF